MIAASLQQKIDHHFVSKWRTDRRLNLNRKNEASNRDCRIRLLLEPASFDMMTKA
jgi:hypothetical protein